MFRSTILRSLKPLHMSHSQRTMTIKKNGQNPFVKEKLPTLTPMETITMRHRNLETLVQTHVTSRKVKYGDYNLMECNEGYILCYINAFRQRKEPHNVFYGVFYGEDHPLNSNGPVKGVQSLLHGKDTAILNAIRNFPKIETKQLCICTDCTVTIGMMRRLPEYSENGYRMSEGRVLERKDTYEQLTAVVRLRDDLKLRIMYAPSDVIIAMRRALWLATLASRPENE
ncbi:hypothetical protein HA402_005525 [Bradysia odoriphaga]|nr:hypothetical protein HA402_005525 [Bradysia odoriphaga]